MSVGCGHYFCSDTLPCLKFEECCILSDLGQMWGLLYLHNWLSLFDIMFWLFECLRVISDSGMF